MIGKIDNKLKQCEKTLKRKNKEIIKINDGLSMEKKTSKKWNALSKRCGSEKYYAENKVKEIRIDNTMIEKELNKKVGLRIDMLFNYGDND